MGSAAPRDLTGANKAWDAAPVFSANGKTLYYRAMKRPGFEADRFALMEMNLASGMTREIDPAWDRSADGIKLSADGKTIYTAADDMGQHPLFAVNIATGAVKKIVADGTVSAIDVAGDTLVFTRDSMKSPDQLFVAHTDGSAQRPVSHNNDDALKGTAFGDYEQFSFAGWNNETVHGFVVKPWNYQPGKKYPVAFLIHGGPQGSFGNDWSFRWNPETYAGQGYAVVMIDFHGSTGYGQAFTDAISKHWGDRPLEDLQKGWAAALQNYQFLDGNDACALGRELRRLHDLLDRRQLEHTVEVPGRSRRRVRQPHDGLLDRGAVVLRMGERWHAVGEPGGLRALQSGRSREGLESADADRAQPVGHAHSGSSRASARFTALQRKGIESKYLYFPNENHWVLKPQNSVEWHDTVNAWLKEHLQPAQ